MENWNETYKWQMILQINETYQFANNYATAEEAAYNVRIGYENDPEWFSFVVDDLDSFEDDVKRIIKQLFYER